RSGTANDAVASWPRCKKKHRQVLFFGVRVASSGVLGRLSYFRNPFLLASLGQAALVSSSRVLVDQTFARGAVEESDGRHFVLSSPARRALERGAKRGFLGAVADGSGARFPHVLFR